MAFDHLDQDYDHLTGKLAACGANIVHSDTVR